MNDRGQFRGKRPRADASFGGAQWGQELPDINNRPAGSYVIHDAFGVGRRVAHAAEAAQIKAAADRRKDAGARKTPAQLEAEIATFLREDDARLSAGRRSHSTKKLPVAQLAPVYHDRLATGIARVVRDPYFWKDGRFDLAGALQPLAAKRGHYDWQRVKDYADDELQMVRGTASAGGAGFTSRAAHPITAREVAAVNAIVNALKRAERQL